MSKSAKLTPADVLRRGEVEGVTAYGISILVNAKLRELQVQKDGKLVQIRPQMMYNYDRNGLIVKGQKSVVKDRNFTVAEAVTFVDSYVTKVANKHANKATEEATEVEGQLELDLIEA